MKKVLEGLVLSALFLSFSFPAAGQKSPEDRLYDAARAGDVNAVQSQLNQGADIEGKRTEWYREFASTPLNTAVQNGHLEVIKLLLDRGANPDGANRHEGAFTTPLFAVMANKDLDVVRRGEVVKLLASRGASLNAKTMEGEYPLEFAARLCGIECVRPLLDQGADIESKGYGGQTPLAAAVYRPDVVKLLLDRGANIEAKDNGGSTALHEAASAGNLDAINLLLDRGANIEAKASDGSTPLFRAEYQHPDALRLLLERGADMEVVTKSGRTPMDEAAYYHRDNVVKMLQQWRSDRQLLEQTKWKNSQEKFAAYLSVFHNEPRNEALRKQLIQISTALPALPAIPEEARHHFVRGAALFKAATSQADYKQVTDEFNEATHLAPWWPEAYYNCALAFEAAGEYETAIKDLKLYLLFKLPLAEARAAHDKIYALEVNQEQAGKAKVQADAAAAAAVRERAQAATAAAAAQQKVREEQEFDAWFKKIEGAMYFPVGSRGLEDSSDIGRCMLWIERPPSAATNRPMTWWLKFPKDPRNHIGGWTKSVFVEVADHHTNNDGSITISLAYRADHSPAGQLVFSGDHKSFTQKGAYGVCGDSYYTPF
jgi:ankyrin repeat protein